MHLYNIFPCNICLSYRSMEEQVAAFLTPQGNRQLDQSYKRTCLIRFFKSFIFDIEIILRNILFVIKNYRRYIFIISSIYLSYRLSTIFSNFVPGQCYATCLYCNIQKTVKRKVRRKLSAL